MDGWMDGWMERGKEFTDQVLNHSPYSLFSCSQCLLHSTLCSYLPYALQVEWVKEFRSETSSLPPCLHFWVRALVPLSGIRAHSFLTPSLSMCPLDFPGGPAVLAPALWSRDPK